MNFARALAIVVATVMCVGANAAMPPPVHAGRGTAAAVQALLQRVLGSEAAAAHLELEIVAACAAPPAKGARSKLCYDLAPGSAAGTVAVRGTSGVELALSWVAMA